LNKKIDFIVVGAAKSGTTTLHDLLSKHPKVCLPAVKETHFFDIDSNYDRGLDYYMSFFKNRSGGESVIGEVTPSYMFVDGVAKRIYEMMGSKVKLVFILRQPAERAFSHYSFNLARGIENLPFNKAIELESKRIQVSHKETRRYSYISRGYYYRQISEYLKFFDISQMHFIIFEEFLNNKSESFEALLDFLNLESIDIDYNVNSNYTARAKYAIVNRLINGDSLFKKYFKKILEPKSRRIIRNYIRDFNVGAKLKSNSVDPEFKKSLTQSFFREDIILLEELIGRRIKAWN
jgi:hypothetical protein